jgi:hypothetical protein
MQQTIPSTALFGNSRSRLPTHSIRRRRPSLFDWRELRHGHLLDAGLATPNSRISIPTVDDRLEHVRGPAYSAWKGLFRWVHQVVSPAAVTPRNRERSQRRKRAVDPASRSVQHGTLVDRCSSELGWFHQRRAAPFTTGAFTQNQAMPRAIGSDGPTVTYFDGLINQVVVVLE